MEYHIYGPNYTPEKKCSRIVYQGEFSADELPAHLKGQFGLIWDGSSVNTCEGNFGEYLRYNNPHKISLYLACGLPVIIWAVSYTHLIRGSNVTSALNENYGIPTGILISEVVAGGPASSSDLKAKDIITAINGESVKTMTELQKQLTYLEGGSTVTLTVQRLEDRQYVEKSIDVVLGYKTDAQ